MWARILRWLISWQGSAGLLLPGWAWVALWVLVIVHAVTTGDGGRRACGG